MRRRGKGWLTWFLLSLVVWIYFIFRRREREFLFIQSFYFLFFPPMLFDIHILLSFLYRIQGTRIQRQGKRKRILFQEIQLKGLTKIVLHSHAWQIEWNIHARLDLEWQENTAQTGRITNTLQETMNSKMQLFFESLKIHTFSLSLFYLRRYSCFVSIDWLTVWRCFTCLLLSSLFPPVTSFIPVKKTTDIFVNWLFVRIFKSLYHFIIYFCGERVKSKYLLPTPCLLEDWMFSLSSLYATS